MSAADGYRPESSKRVMVQNIQTSKAVVDLAMGVKRGAERSAAKDPERFIGSRALANFDEAFNIYEGDLLVTDLRDPPFEHSYDSVAFDGRVAVFSSLASYRTHAAKMTRRQFSRGFRIVGVAWVDKLISSAATNQASYYGISVCTGGAMSGPLHVVPEEIGAGEYLVADFGPVGKEEREEWSRDFEFNTTTFRHGCEKPVLRPFRPYAAADALSESIERWVTATELERDSAERPLEQSLANSVDYQQLVCGRDMAKGALTAMWLGIALLTQAGLLTINFAAFDEAKLLEKKTTADQQAQNFALAQRLGLIGHLADGEQTTMQQLVLAYYQSYVGDSQSADMLDMYTLLPRADDARRIQSEGSVRLMQAIVDGHYDNVSQIVGKSTSNSIKGDPISMVISQ